MRRTPRRAQLVVCAALLCPSALAHERPRLEPVGRDGSLGCLVRPTNLSSPRPVTVYLHGLCGGPENGCPRFRDGVTERSWLLCPRAPARCGPGASWGAPNAARLASIARITSAAERLAPGGVDRSTPGVLIAFSQGAYVAGDILRASRGRWRGVAFIAADVHLTREGLERAGVRRVVLAAGRRDMTRRALEATASRLAAEGFPVRFVDLGAVGHTYVPTRSSEGWGDALSWLWGA